MLIFYDVNTRKNYELYIVKVLKQKFIHVFLK